MIKVIDGDILTLSPDNHICVCHQVNCQGVMGAGLARQIRVAYPQVYEEYRALCRANPTQLLGLFQPIRITPTFTVANCFAQVNYGRNGLFTDYAALKKCMEAARLFAETSNGIVRIPYKIGCGLGGGDWNVVYEIIETAFSNSTVYIWKYDKK